MAYARTALGVIARTAALAVIVTMAATVFPLAQEQRPLASGPDVLYDKEGALPLIKACLKRQAEKGESAEACLGLSMKACMRHRINETTNGSIRCAMGENAAWEAIIDEATSRIARNSDAALRAKLENSQSRWVEFKRGACGVWRDVFRGGSMGRQIGADCIREKAGRRALDLLAIAEALEL